MNSNLPEGTNPATVQINELARELEVRAKAIIDLLPQCGITEKKTHSDRIPADIAEKVRKKILGQAKADGPVSEIDRTKESTEQMKEAPAPPSQTVTAKSLLIGWVNELDAWVRHHVSEVVISRKALTDSQLDAVYQTFSREKALDPGDPVNVPNLSDNASSLDARSGLFLTQLRDLRNVNALVEGQNIDFNPKLTIVFGENACGKTGYVRVLKKAAAVGTTEAVLPDVSQVQAAKQAPSARIAFRLGLEGSQEVEWKDQAGLVPFNRIDVFDSRATALHVDGDLNYIYTPGELVRFPLVQQGIEGVRSRLEKGISDRTQTTNPFLLQFDRQSRIYPLIDSLGAATDLAELKAMSGVAEAEKEEIPTLRTEIDALQTTNPAAQMR